MAGPSAECRLIRVVFSSAGQIEVKGALAGCPLPSDLALNLSGRDVLVNPTDVTWTVQEQQAVFEFRVEAGFIITGPQVVTLRIERSESDPLTASAGGFTFMTGGGDVALANHGMLILDQPGFDEAATWLVTGEPLIVDGWAMGPGGPPGPFGAGFVDGAIVANAPVDRPRGDLAALNPAREEAAWAGFRAEVPQEAFAGSRHLLSLEVELQDGGCGPRSAVALVRPGEATALGPCEPRDSTRDEGVPASAARRSPCWSAPM